MKNTAKYRTMTFHLKTCVILLIVLCSMASVSLVAFADNSVQNLSESKRLENGSFESGQTWSGSYKQLDQSIVPSWNTTATGGLIEILQENTGVYIPGVTLKPTAGAYAAELNADEESTLYQNIKTTPSSLYEWGLDHGSRNGKDIMALVIGPKQDVDPSKPSKDGRDQFMQMVDWLGIESSDITAGDTPQRYTVYSKKFASNGTFEDNAGNNAFSLTPSTIYTEEWSIWVMASCRATTESVNPWNSYGSNANGSAGKPDGSGNTTVDLDKYYLYAVPAGQTETLFGFVSVGFEDSSASGGKEKTYGNFLDNINFEIYHPLSGSTTTHGSAVIGGSSGSIEGSGSSNGHKVTVDSDLITYVVDGEPLKIQAVVEKEDFDARCEFVGVYYTVQDDEGNPVTKFLKLAGNEIEDSEDLTDEQKAGKWVKSVNEDGDIVYTRYLENITSATDLHFIFIKSPTITYDSNGGKPYIVDRVHNTEEATNVYSFKPVMGYEEGSETIFIDPYVSHMAEGQNDGWKFIGWLLTGDIVEGQEGNEALDTLLLPGIHTVACDYTISEASQQSATQHFKIYDDSISLEKVLQYREDETGDLSGVFWNDNGVPTLYANPHKGLTMVAQWRWLQAFIPQVGSNGVYVDSDNGGYVEIISVKDTSENNTNYNSNYNGRGGKSYFATMDEVVTVKATPKDGFVFEGWYDEDGNLITTNAIYSYTETKESVNTYYAKFSGNVTQTYIRQVKTVDGWVDIEDDNIGVLGRYSYTDAVGMPISSTAMAGNGYKFVGWYDFEGNPVPSDMLINDGFTISYKTTGNATYYARFDTYSISKVVENSTIEIGGSNTWELHFGSSSSEPVEGVSLVDILPYNGDSNGSTFSGSYIITEVIIDYSNAPSWREDSFVNSFVSYTKSTSVRTTNNVLGFTDWSSNSVPVGTEDNNLIHYSVNMQGLTALYLYLGDVPAYEDIVVYVGVEFVDSNGKLMAGSDGSVQQAGDVYCNSFSQYANNQVSVVKSNIVSFHSVGRSLSGLAWLDSNMDGERQSDEEGISGLTVNLYTTTSNGSSDGVWFDSIGVTLYPAYNVLGGRVGAVRTGSDGSYAFSNLAGGEYYVVFTGTEGHGLTYYHSVQNTSVDSDSKAIVASPINSYADIEDALQGAYISSVVLPDTISNTYEYCSANNDSGFVDLPSPSQAIAKVANRTKGVSLNPVSGRYTGTKRSGLYRLGDTIKFLITITNTGNCTLNNLVIRDDISEMDEYVSGFGYTANVGDILQTSIGNTATVVSKIVEDSVYSMVLNGLEAGDSVDIECSAVVQDTPIPVDIQRNTVSVESSFGYSLELSSGESYLKTPDTMVDGTNYSIDYDEFILEEFNVSSLGSITLYKCSSIGNYPLSGVVFVLEGDDGSTYTLATDEAGYVRFEDLPSQKYLLTETSTVNGYILLSESIEITIPLAIPSSDVGDLDISEGYYSDSDDCYYFYDLNYTVVNDPIFKMPDTGRDDLIILGECSFVLLAISVYFLGWIIRRRKL